MRAVWPERLPPTIRVGAIDFRPETHPLEDSIALTEVLAGRGGDLVDVRMGLNSDEVAVPWNDRGCMVPFAARIRREAGVPVAVRWNLGDPMHAHRVIRDGQADLLMIDRPALMNPHWPVMAAMTLGERWPLVLLPMRYRSFLEKAKHKPHASGFAGLRLAEPA